MTSRGHRARILQRARDWSRRFAPLHVFGGQPLLEAELPRSASSGQPLHLTFDLDVSDPRLEDLGVTSVRRLAIPACFDADEPDPLLVRHHDGGRRLELLAEPEPALRSGLPEVLPQLPVELEDLSEAEAACEMVDELPDGHEPLHRVGGRPLWAGRRRAAPRCPVTGRAMRYVATVDSVLRFPLGSSEAQLLFGDRGLLHVYWSDEAAVSAAVIDSP